jgi:hypothetical protein
MFVHEMCISLGAFSTLGPLSVAAQGAAHGARESPAGLSLLAKSTMHIFFFSHLEAPGIIWEYRSRSFSKSVALRTGAAKTLLSRA